MGSPDFHIHNHYVPSVYLKNFSRPDGKIETYRILVPHSKVPEWKPFSIKGIAYYEHLYTQLLAGEETDSIERWLDREFEAPAEEALQKIISNGRLTPADWRCLIRFLAAQDVRTPARLIERLQRWETELPSMMQEILESSVQKLESMTPEQRASLPVNDTHEPLPFRLRKEIEPGQEYGKLKAELIAGRSLWLSGFRHVLTETLNVLYQHKWTVLTAPEDLPWFTSDNPVIKLNYYRPGSYDLRGGWGNPGTEIILPLSPHHLLYTKVGYRSPSRGTIAESTMAKMVRCFIAENAHRMIFASLPDITVSKLRPRVIDAISYTKERKEWQTWHKRNKEAEQKLIA